MFRNKKGTLAGIEIAMIAVLIGVFTLGAAEKKFNIYDNIAPKFRTRKAVEKCLIIEGVSEADCKVVVNGMSKSEILVYIKDDVIWGNGGFVQ